MKRIVLVGGLAVLAVALVGTLVDAQPAYIGASKCKMCHKLQFDSWQETAHAKATENAKASTKWKFEAACLSCHATDNSEELAGVQCEACHGPGADYKSIQVMKDRQKAIAAGLVVPTQETCNRCHDGKDHHTRVDIKTAPPPHAFKK